uniref:Protein odr-4 homolog n=5 Tax=Rhodosorus marinus TaxID=101924 RepID=A0A7S2ZTI1_9RHOD|mmetsp:Transcript_30192/g.115788  ORF Transcript_30192/g.115788 Transcript_30192/m.115788 type:complete len:376 (+) Transcript_30192:317-1444(+)|eukprot:CAMPEP_0113963890 /NCGR_PEP_ID=MMETSP0011_2-20120614/6788_1 /TAXON_ID=101924 /ORGANISM="Rhodosorus marinus" /LENGTH=375 /DNA_ID=CAMNT_0000976037 /DNA_START=121 /DNA_END=1248 /DNA_ORIENTATION=+ /assembly_acc=CAM_ASM_000156
MGRKLLIEEQIFQEQGRGVLIGRHASNWIAIGAVKTPQEPEGSHLGGDRWSVEHSQQVEEALPGGLCVIGVFSLSSIESDARLIAFASGACRSVAEPIIVSRTSQGSTRFVCVGEHGAMTRIDQQTITNVLDMFVRVNANTRVSILADHFNALVDVVSDAYEDSPAALMDGKQIFSGISTTWTSSDLRLLLPSKSVGTTRKISKQFCNVNGEVALNSVVEKSCSAVDLTKALKQDLRRSLITRLDRMVSEESAEEEQCGYLAARCTGSLDGLSVPISEYLSPYDELDDVTDRIEFLFSRRVANGGMKMMERRELAKFTAEGAVDGAEQSVGSRNAQLPSKVSSTAAGGGLSTPLLAASLVLIVVGAVIAYVLSRT